MISHYFGHAFDRYAAALVTAPLLRQLSPAALTVTGMVLGCGAAALIASGQLCAGGVVVLLAGLFDILDGAAARARNSVTAFGAFLDSVCDRCSDLAIASGFIIYYAGHRNTALVGIACLAAIGTALVPYARARAECFITQCTVGIAERPERVLIIAAGCLTGLAGPALVVICVLTAVTVCQRIRWTYRQAAKPDKETLP